MPYNDVFISYSHDDQSTMERLRAVLTKADLFRVAVDHEIRKGDFIFCSKRTQQHGELPRAVTVLARVAVQTLRSTAMPCGLCGSPT